MNVMISEAYVEVMQDPHYLRRQFFFFLKMRNTAGNPVCKRYVNLGLNFGGDLLGLKTGASYASLALLIARLLINLVHLGLS